MATTAFPKAWKVRSGTVGTDITASAVALSGGTSVHFPSGGGDAQLVSKWYRTMDSNSASSGNAAVAYYSVAAILRASSVAAGNQIRVTLELADQTRATATTSTVFNGTLTAANTWEWKGTVEFIGAAQWQWYRLIIDRPSSRTFDAYVDSVELKQLPCHLLHVGTGAFQGPTTTSWQPVDYPVAGFLSKNTCSWDATNLRAVVDAPGVYCVSGSIFMLTADDGDTFGISAHWQGSGGGTLKRKQGTTLALPTTLSNPVAEVTSHYYLDSGQAVSIEVRRNTGTDRSFLGDHFELVRLTDR